MFTGASCCELHVAASPGSPRPGVLQPLPAQHGGEHSSRLPQREGSRAGLSSPPILERRKSDVGHGKSSYAAPGILSAVSERLWNVRNNTNTHTTSCIPHLELMSRATVGTQALEKTHRILRKTNFLDTIVPGI